MQVKTYTGANTQEVLAMIKAELGPDAVILSSRTYRKGGVRCHEMTAGVERGEREVQGAVNELTGAGRGEMFSAGVAAGSGGAGPSGGGTPPGWGEWHKEWLQIKDHLFALMKPSIQLERLTPRQRVALEYLQREGVSDVVVLELYRRLLIAPGASVLESLSEIVPVRPWNAEEWPMRVHMVVGPYGSGKTTTALRMALALRAKNPEARIAFINADCHRGNGRLVLRHWAELSDFSYMEAQDPMSMEKALVACAGADRVFVDMPGLSRDTTLKERRAALGLDKSAGEERATHVVLSPCYDGAQLTALLQRYAPDGVASLIWTKLDESVSYGTLVNTAAACHLPVSALSCGPGLKDTLCPASESQLWRLIFKRQLPGGEA